MKKHNKYEPNADRNTIDPRRAYLGKHCVRLADDLGDTLDDIQYHTEDDYLSEDEYKVLMEAYEILLDTGRYLQTNRF